MAGEAAAHKDSQRPHSVKAFVCQGYSPSADRLLRQSHALTGGGGDWRGGGRKQGPDRQTAGPQWVAAVGREGGVFDVERHCWVVCFTLMTKAWAGRLPLSP